jgi:hypothetical protein
MFHYKNKEIVVYNQCIKTATATLYNGIEFKQIPTSQMMEIRKRPFDYDELFCKTDAQDLKKYYESYTKDVKHLYDATDGKINLYQCASVVQEAIRYFKSIQKIEPDTIEGYEIDYISNAGGGVRIADQGYEGVGFKYDIRSFYPYILLKKNGIPVKKGVLKSITDSELMHTLSAGIYHCEIIGTDPKLFTVLKSNMYTHYEVQLAKELGLEIKLLSEQYMDYSKDKSISSGSIFKDYVKPLYKLKKEGNKIAKLMLNCLWGNLVSRKKYKYYRTIDEMEIRETDKILDILTQPNGKIMFKIVNKDDRLQFNHSYARLKPFLLGYARVFMHRLVKKVKSRIKTFMNSKYIMDLLDLSTVYGLLEPVLTTPIVNGPIAFINSHSIDDIRQLLSTIQVDYMGILSMAEQFIPNNNTATNRIVLDVMLRTARNRLSVDDAIRDSIMSNLFSTIDPHSASGLTDIIMSHNRL